MNGIVNEIKYNNEKSPPQAKFFTTSVAVAQKINEILKEIEPEAKFCNRICYSRTQIINEILNEIEIQELRKPAAGEIFFKYLSHSQT